MQAFASFLNLFLGALAIIATLISIGLVASLFSAKARQSGFARLLADKAAVVGLVVSAVATIGSLLYSDVIGYEPCKLCWFQRIFMYPQVILFLAALWKKDRMVRLYGLVLSVLGGAIALFHYIGQLGLNPLKLDCLAVGYSSSCAQNFVLTYGFVTIPFMALSAFVLIALTMSLSFKRERESRITS